VCRSRKQYLFINALTENIKKLGLGVKCGELILAQFADDIALMAETEKDLQLMLNALHFWCEYWLLRINISKTKLITPDKRPSFEPIQMWPFKNKNCSLMNLA